MPDKKHILYCDCACYDFVAQDSRQRLISAIENCGLPYSIVPDLCKLCADGDDKLRLWAESEKLTVIACYPRAIKWLFRAGRVELKDEKVDFANARNQREVENILERLARNVSPPKASKPEKPSGWIPWFPVIDYSRCVNCKKCLNFCLFGTYALSSEGQVEVENPRACKTNCPACARICPQSAIIFPKHNASPINGDQPDTNSKIPNNMNIDYSRLVTDNIYEKLKNRGKGKRFSADTSSECDLEELQKKLGIPADVIATFSPQDISRAREQLKESKD